MQKHHPTDHIAWGAASHGGKALAKKWHRHHQKVSKSIGEPHEGQFDPF